MWTREDFRAICHRMLNGNGDHYFMQAYYDERKAKAVFPKSKTVRASKRLEWAFDTICGKAKNKTGIGFYPDNDDDETCWGALDFDAHNTDERTGRAYGFAGKAFDLLCREAPFLWVIAGTSGQSGGWHVFLFSPYFHPTGEWTRFLREVADRIGAQLQSGICEVFPDDNRGQKKGIRAPGTWNPKDDSFGQIAHDSVTKGLKALRSDKGKTSLSVLCDTTGEDDPLSHSRQNLPLYRGEDNCWKGEFAITSTRSRNEKLTKLVGTAFWQASKAVVRENARLQYTEATPAPLSSLVEHFEEFERLWDGKYEGWLASLSSFEREKFDKLANENDREAFRIIYNWSKADPDSFDFRVGCEYLAERLGVTLKTASRIRERFCAADILRRTAKYVPYKLTARYEWIANKERKRLLKVEPMSREAGGWQGPPPLRLIGCPDHRDDPPFELFQLIAGKEKP